ncbi:MAG: hypothetical protein HYV28_08645 [Ignavibacteriales bacterium]|nr:hypothetical protein [Ignavibacteriales bacterium]
MQQVQQALKISSSTANAIIADFVRLGILHETTEWKRTLEFEFAAYLDLFRG